MRKHFLILMLGALLPLCAFADKKDATVIVTGSESATYTPESAGKAPLSFTLVSTNTGADAGKWTTSDDYKTLKNVKVYVSQGTTIGSETEITIPETVTIPIDIKQGGALKHQTTITVDVTEVGNGTDAAFTKAIASKLTKVTLGSKVTTVAAKAFQDFYLLEDFVWNEKVTTIGANAFEGTTLKALSLPATVTTIGASAFKAKEVDDAKRMCSFSTVVIPANVTTIGANAFEGCENLSTFTVNSTQNLVIEQGALAWTMVSSLDLTNTKMATFGKNGATCSPFTSATHTTNLVVTEVKLPTTCTTVNVNAFKGCTNLNSLGANGLTKVKTINANAFEGCANLTAVSIGTAQNSAITIAANAFKACAKLATVELGTVSGGVSAAAFNGATVYTTSTANTANAALDGALAEDAEYEDLDDDVIDDVNDFWATSGYTKYIFTADGAAAYNASLGGVSTGDDYPTEFPEGYEDAAANKTLVYTLAGANAYNLVNATEIANETKQVVAENQAIEEGDQATYTIAAGFAKYIFTADGATAYNAIVLATGAKEEGDDVPSAYITTLTAALPEEEEFDTYYAASVTHVLSAAGAAAYNANLEGAVKAGQISAPGEAADVAGIETFTFNTISAALDAEAYNLSKVITLNFKKYIATADYVPAGSFTNAFTAAGKTYTINYNVKSQLPSEGIVKGINVAAFSADAEAERVITLNTDTELKIWNTANAIHKVKIVGPDFTESIIIANASSKLMKDSKSSNYYYYFKADGSNYSIAKSNEGDATVTLYQVYADVEENPAAQKIYYMPLRTIGGKYVVEDGEVIIIKSDKENGVKATPTEDDPTMAYDNGGNVINDLELTAVAYSKLEIQSENFLLNNGANDLFFLRNPEGTQGFGFAKYDPTKQTSGLNKNAVYLTCAALDASAPVMEIWLDEMGNTTAIKTIETGVNNVKNGEMFNLQGIRVNGAAQKGIYIINGKKVVK